MNPERIICEVSDDGNKVRVLYPPDSEHRIICGSDDTYATHAEMDAAIADTWAVLDEYEARIAALERPTMDSDGVLLSHNEYAILQRIAAIGASVPWTAIATLVGSVGPEWTRIANKVEAWLDANAPQEDAQ